MCLNLKLVQISWKAPPPPFCLLVRYSAHVVAHDVTSCTDISCIIEHHIGDELAETPPPRMREIFFHWIYPFQTISSNFGFCGIKAPPPNMKEKFSTGSIHFKQFQETLVFVAEKPPPPDEWKIFPLDLSISDNFKQLWFLWQKSPSPHWMREKFFPLDLSISDNFELLWFLWQKKPLPLFCLFMKDLTHVTHVEYPWSPYYKSALRFLLSEYFL